MAKRTQQQEQEEHKHRFIFENTKEQLKMCQCGQLLMSTFEYGQRIKLWNNYYFKVNRKWLPHLKRTIRAFCEGKMEEAKRLSQVKFPIDIPKPKFSDPQFLGHERKLEVYQ